MLGTDIALKHYVAAARVREFHAESERRRAVDLALAGQSRLTFGLGATRATVARMRIRAGAWLMPAGAADCQPAAGALGLRLGR
jgi:hypothetical protein